MKNLFKQSQAVLLVVAAISAPLGGCTSSEVANAVGAAAIIGGAVVIGANTHCEGGYRNECHEVRDYRGFLHTECRQIYDSCAVLVPNGESVSTNDAASADQAVTDVAWGMTFGISFDASKTFIDAMKSARAGNMSALTGLGLSKSDIMNIAQFKSASDEGIDAVAANLGQDKDAIRDMLTQLSDTAKEHQDEISR